MLDFSFPSWNVADAIQRDGASLVCVSVSLPSQPRQAPEGCQWLPKLPLDLGLGRRYQTEHEIKACSETVFTSQRRVVLNQSNPASGRNSGARLGEE